MTKGQRIRLRKELDKLEIVLSKGAIVTISPHKSYRLRVRSQAFPRQIQRNAKSWSVPAIYTDGLLALIRETAALGIRK